MSVDISIKNATKKFGENTVISNISLDIKDKEIVLHYEDEKFKEVLKKGKHAFFIPANFKSPKKPF